MLLLRSSLICVAFSLAVSITAYGQYGGGLPPSLLNMCGSDVEKSINPIIPSPTSWFQSGNTYTFLTDITIENGESCIIEPGAILEFAAGTKLIVGNGYLVCGYPTRPPDDPVNNMREFGLAACDCQQVVMRGIPLADGSREKWHGIVIKKDGYEDYNTPGYAFIYGTDIEDATTGITVERGYPLAPWGCIEPLGYDNPFVWVECTTIKNRGAYNGTPPRPPAGIYLHGVSAAHTSIVRTNIIGDYTPAGGGSPASGYRYGILVHADWDQGAVRSPLLESINFQKCRVGLSIQTENFTGTYCLNGDKFITDVRGNSFNFWNCNYAIDVWDESHLRMNNCEGGIYIDSDMPVQGIFVGSRTSNPVINASMTMAEGFGGLVIKNEPDPNVQIGVVANIMTQEKGVLADSGLCNLLLYGHGYTDNYQVNCQTGGKVYLSLNVGNIIPGLYNIRNVVEGAPLTLPGPPAPYNTLYAADPTSEIWMPRIFWFREDGLYWYNEYPPEMIGSGLITTNPAHTQIYAREPSLVPLQNCTAGLVGPKIGAEQNENATANINASSLAPNPVASNAVLALNADEDQVVDITVSDMLGRRIATYNSTQLKQGQNQIPLDLSSLKPGAYFIQAIGSGTAFKSLMFTVQK